MRPASVALPLLAVVSLLGCADNAELKKARAEAEEAKTELANVKGELEVLKKKLSAPSDLSPAFSEEAARKIVQAFFADIGNGFLRSAYDSMSLSYQERTNRPMFDQFFEKHSNLKLFASNFSSMEHTTSKLRKLDEKNAYECDLVSSVSAGNFSRRVNVTVRLVAEKGLWKIDDFLEIKSWP